MGLFKKKIVKKTYHADQIAGGPRKIQRDI